MKACYGCGVEKELSEFYLSKHFKDGIHNLCKTCVKERNRESRIRNITKVKERSKIKYDADRIQILAQKKQYYKENSKIKKEQSNEYRSNHKLEHWAINTTNRHKIKHLRAAVLEAAKRTKCCPICRRKLTYSEGMGKSAATLDRIENGVTGPQSTLDDFWIICFDCNSTKRDRTCYEMDDWCIKWLKLRGV